MSTISVIRAQPPALGRCHSPRCEQPIEWVTTTNGKRMPIDAPLVAESTHERLDGSLVCLVDTKRSHFATCPDAKTFKRERR